ncbi:unnamed protein product [Phytophthora fragariaefolia]|uniref:Unnamed protein product n=1 Tax=Phytophthora fragariaefolia TaxID=1490495 RepID=A0A9W7CXR4_9STRA|nr:unnamed protein product [Phytophthora fragariaefolia]
MGARRSIPPLVGFLDLSSRDKPVAMHPSGVLSEGEGASEADEESSTSAQTDSTPGQRSPNDHTEHPVDSEEVELGRMLETPSPANPPKTPISQQQHADALENIQVLKDHQEKQERDSERNLTREQAQSGKFRPSTANCKCKPHRISPSASRIQVKRSKRLVSEFTQLPEVANAAQIHTKVDRLRKGKWALLNLFANGVTNVMLRALKETDESAVGSEGLHRTLIPTSKNDSSDSEEVRVTREDNMVESCQSHIEDADKAHAKPSSMVVSIDRTTTKYKFSLLTRSACGFHADKPPQSKATENAKISMKTIIAVPRKFAEAMVPLKSTRSASSTLPMAPPPRLDLTNRSAFSVGSGVKPPMTPKKKTGSVSTRGSSSRQSVVLTEGDWLGASLHPSKSPKSPDPPNRQIE